MSSFLNPTQLIHQILGIQKDVYANDIGKPVTIKDSYINEFSKSENSVRVIFDQVHFKILHISDNIEILGGYSTKDFQDANMPFALNLFTVEHMSFPYVWLKWALHIQARHGILIDRQVVCGIKVKHKDGHIVRLLIRQFALEINDHNIATVSAFTLDDISHIMKADFYWGRMAFVANEQPYAHHFVSTNKEDKPSDIISDREIETLRLLAQGKESKEIGKELFISSHTVDNHRRNMIQKLGVKDTTGLVQICKMIGII
jgi:DNA-binding CsgD family transcriptional regulator